MAAWSAVLVWVDSESWLAVIVWCGGDNYTAIFWKLKLMIEERRLLKPVFKRYTFCATWERIQCFCIFPVVLLSYQWMRLNIFSALACRRVPEMVCPPLCWWWPLVTQMLPITGRFIYYLLLKGSLFLLKYYLLPCCDYYKLKGSPEIKTQNYGCLWITTIWMHIYGFFTCNLCIFIREKKKKKHK